MPPLNPFNPLFTPDLSPEKALQEQMITEAIRARGFPVYYIPREVVQLDNILNEDLISRFSSAYEMYVYLEDMRNFSGSGYALEMHGIKLDRKAEFVISRKEWNDLVATPENLVEGSVPKEGALIYVPFAQTLFEVVKVQREHRFYQLLNTPTFLLEAKLYVATNEKFDTGVEEIDTLIGNSLAATVYVYHTTGSVPFEIGELVVQAFENHQISAKVAYIIEDGLPSGISGLALSGIRTSEPGRGTKFKADENNPLVGQDSGASEIITKTGYLKTGHEQNEEFSQTTPVLPTFDPNNPFNE